MEPIQNLTFHTITVCLLRSSGAYDFITTGLIFPEGEMNWESIQAKIKSQYGDYTSIGLMYNQELSKDEYEKFWKQ